MSEDLEITPLAANVYVAGQIGEGDVDRIRQLGVQVLVCNRPDGEADQIPSTRMAELARAAGMEFVYLPMSNPDDTAAQAPVFKDILDKGGKVLAYCRTGRRSSALWQVATR